MIHESSPFLITNYLDAPLTCADQILPLSSGHHNVPNRQQSWPRVSDGGCERLANRILNAYPCSTTWQLTHNTRHRLSSKASISCSNGGRRLIPSNHSGFRRALRWIQVACQRDRLLTYNSTNMQGPSHGNHPKGPYSSSPSLLSLLNGITCCRGMFHVPMIFVSH